MLNYRISRWSMTATGNQVARPVAAAMLQSIMKIGKRTLTICLATVTTSSESRQLLARKYIFLLSFILCPKTSTHESFHDAMDVCIDSTLDVRQDIYQKIIIIINIKWWLLIELLLSLWLQRHKQILTTTTTKSHYESSESCILWWNGMITLNFLLKMDGAGGKPRKCKRK